MKYFFLMNSTGTCAWRVYPIQKALEEEGHDVVAVNLPSFTEDMYERILNWADVLTFQMVSAKSLVDLANKKGIYTIFDTDDLIGWVPPKHPQAKVTKKRDYQKMFKDTMRKVNQITYSSPLMSNYKEYNKNATCLPNYLPDYFWEKPQLKNDSKQIRLGWAGGASHQEDLDFIAPIVEKVLKRHPEVKLVYTGGGGWSDGTPTSEIRHGEDHFKDIPQAQKEYCMSCPVEIWPSRLNSMRLDIAMAPLDDNVFARHKTHIKYFEYGINHWAGVYQKFLYKDVVKHGETGFLATTPEEWEKYIEKLIKDTKLRKEMGERAYKDVKDNHTFGGNIGEWLRVYREAGKLGQKGKKARKTKRGKRSKS